MPHADQGLERRIDVGGLTLHVMEHGDGVPVLVLHGFAGSARSMAPIVTRLAEHHRVVAVDLVGHGRSDAPHDAASYAWSAVTRQLKRVLDALRVEHAHLLGFSLGGRIALQLAARHEERVRSAFVVGSRALWLDEAERDPRRRSDATLAERIAVAGIGALAAPAIEIEDEALRAAAPDAGTHGLALALRALGAADQPEVAAQLALGAVPLCLVAGENDAGPLAASRALAADLPCARLIEIAGAGHRAHLERPDEVTALALGFFAEVDAEQETRSTPRASHATNGRGENAW